MKNGKRLQSSSAALLVAVLAIMAFIRGDLQHWLLIAVFTAWILWMLIPNILYMQKKQKIRKEMESGVLQPKNQFYDIRLTDENTDVLVRHVSHRISDYLHCAYPDLTWEWCEERPEYAIMRGGTARIRLFGITDYNYADIIFDRNADIGCDMMRIVPLAELQSSGVNPGRQQKPQPPSDPQIWYELQGRKILESLIADLNAKGHSGLTIKDNGDICIKQAGVEATKDRLKNFPEKNQWQKLIKVFEKEGIMAAVTETGIALTW